MRREDRQLVAGEPEVPGLPLLLDDDELARWAVGHGAELPPRRVYLRFKPGSGGAAALGAFSGQRSADVYLAVWHRAAAPKFDKTVDRLGQHTLVVDADRLALVASARGDRRLPALDRLLEPRLRPGLLRRVAPALPERGAGELRTLAYKPHRRWVGRLDDRAGQPCAVLRAYRRGDLALAAARWTALGQGAGDGRADGALRVPRLLGAHERLGLLAVQHLPGTPLDRALQSGRAGAEQLRAAGAALAVLHEASPSPVRRSVRASARDDVGAVRAAGDMLLRLRPGRADLAALAGEVARALGAADRDAPEVLVHGDFSADQVVLGDDGSVALLDLDELGPGAAAADLASAAADLLVAATAAGTAAPPAGAGRATSWLHEGYDRRRALPPAEQLRAHTAAALLRRAVDPFRAGRPDWPTEVDELLDLVALVHDGRAVPR